MADSDGGAPQGPHLVCLDSVFPPCPIKEGSEVVGRLSLCPTEKQVSRNHFQLKLRKQPFGYQLQIIPLGANRMEVTKKGHTSSVNLIKNHPTVLLDGDIISVLPSKLDRHRFRVLLPNSQTASQLAFFEPVPSPSVKKPSPPIKKPSPPIKKADVVIISDSSPSSSSKGTMDERAALDALKRKRESEVIVLDSSFSERASGPPSKKRKVSSTVVSVDPLPSSSTKQKVAAADEDVGLSKSVSRADPLPSSAAKENLVVDDVSEQSTMDLDPVAKKQEDEPSEDSQDTKLQLSITKMEERLAEELKAAERTRAALVFLKKKRRSSTSSKSPPPKSAPKSPPHRPSLHSQPSLPPSLPASPLVSSAEESIEFPPPIAIAEVTHDPVVVPDDPVEEKPPSEVAKAGASGMSEKVEVSREISDLSAKAIQALEEEELKKTKALQEEQRLADEAFAKSLQPRECLICMDDKEYDHFHQLHGCGHNTNCRDCLLQMFQVAIESKSFPIRVPLLFRHLQILTDSVPNVKKKYRTKI
eukprot:TRINITY_DN5412_c0_g1_i1.p1 TRINITY_DN5412_c0_g1~~TRINITY_DN5412_c0_g1_i1.p1  ORF type:complete len:545 (-),score=133.21 TRINITY_DN5412_c0_g1_i1:569-2158(-)